MQPAARGPIQPQPSSATLDKGSTAILVLDLTVRCDDPEQVCSQLVGGVSAFLDRARAAGVPVLFTGTHGDDEKPEGRVATGIQRRETEPVLYPDGYDKFMGGELQQLLNSRGVRTVVVIGSSTHLCVMYTATTATRAHGYNVVIPLDGVNTRNPYEHEYALHQLSVLPGAASERVQFTTLPEIEFR
jgi:nicotinamidase-related amidase